MKTFVINLKRRPDRREEMERQLRNLNIDNYKFVDAVDGQKLDFDSLDRYVEEVATRHNGEQMLPGEVACALSHISLYERMLEEHLPYCLILEDDVCLPGGFKELAERLILENPTCDVITFNYPNVQVLHTPERGLLKRPLRLTYYLLKIPYNLFLKLYEALLATLFASRPHAVALPRPLYLAGAYVVTSTGAKNLLSYTHPIRYTADKLLNKARIFGPSRLHMKACVPLLVRQDQGRYGSDMNYAQKALL